MPDPIPGGRPEYVRFFAALAVATLLTGLATWWLLLNPGFSRGSNEILFAVPVLLFIVAIAAAAFHFIWRPVLAAYPAREPAPGAVRRRFQSFGLGIMNLAGSIHAAVDDEYLHLVPLWIFRILGARPASIPWSALTPVGRTGRVARLGACRIDGPEWCMKLVAPDTGGS